MARHQKFAHSAPSAARTASDRFREPRVAPCEPTCRTPDVRPGTRGGEETPAAVPASGRKLRLRLRPHLVEDTTRIPPRLLLFASLAALLCLAPGGRPQPAARRFVAVTPAASSADPARLSVVATDQPSDGQRIALRAVVRNDSSEPVEGVRLVLKLLSAPDPAARELDRFYKFVDTRLGPGEQQIVRWDVYTTYAGEIGPTGFVLEAYAARKGTTSFLPPPGWRD